MSFKMKAALATGAIVLAGASNMAAASPECGAIGGKAYAKLYKTLFSVAAKACGDGSGETPGAVDEGKLGKAAEKIIKSLEKAIDKAGDGNCFFTQADLDAVDLATVTAAFVSIAEGFATELCNNDP